MNRFAQTLLRSGIRQRLFALALGLTVPLAALAGSRAFERARRDQEALAERSKTSVVRATQLLDDDLQRARLLLSAASRVLSPTLSRTANDSLIQVIFADAAVGFSNIWVVDSSGALRGSLIEVERVGPGNSVEWLNSRDYFQEAKRTQRFTIGQPVRSSLDPAKRWILPFVHPVYDGTGIRVIGYVGAALRIDDMAAIQYARDLPPNTVLTVLRNDGRVFLRSLDLEKWAPLSFEDSASFRADPRLPRVMQEVESLDGTRRLVAQDTLSSVSATVYLGIPVSATLAVVERQFLLDLITGIILTIGAALVALYIASRIANPIDELSSVAQSLARGEYHRRAAVSGRDEIATLGQAINAMADSVRERQRALEDSEARYRQLFATSPLPTITWQLKDGRIDQMNDAARAFFGAPRLEDENVRVLDLIHPTERERFSALPLPARAETMHAGQWTMSSGDRDDRRVEMYVGRLEQPHEPVIVGVLLDVSERLRAQAALDASRAQLRQSQQLEALGAFAGGIAHDFNNYLSAISTNAEMVRDELPIASPLRGEAEEILLASQRAATLTRQILVFSKRQTAREEWLDLNAEIASRQHMLARLLGDRIGLEVTYAPHLSGVRFVQDGLEQVLMNLAANARDAMPDGGVFRLRTQMMGTQQVQLEISDSGSGIPADVLPRIFEPFFSTKAREKGTGLGLAMVHSIITGARGTIAVSSDHGFGTTITIGLPAASPEPTAATAAITPAGTLRGTEHVLVVEDETAVRAATASLLSRAGYRTSVAASAQEALALLESASSLPDLVLSDVVMPQMNGPQMVATIKHRYPTLRVVFMSGYADDDTVMESVATNTVQLVSKPFSAGELLGAIRRTLDAES